MNKKVLQAIAILVGITVGAGILGIPYVVAQSGLIIGIIHLVVIGAAILILNLYVGEVALRTKGIHELIGYSQKYLKGFSRFLMKPLFILGAYGALIAYLIGEGQSLAAIFNINNPLLFTTIFFILMSVLLLSGLKALERSELILASLFFLVVIIIAVLSLPKADVTNLQYTNPAKAFIPYGVILFAFIGSSAIPEMREELANNKKQLKKAIIIGSILPFFIYLIFTLSVLAVTGVNTTEIATIGLGNILGEKMLLIGNIFAVLTMATSFIAIGFALKWNYQYDYKLSNITSFILTCFIPYIIVLLNITTFIKTLALTGALIGGLQGILIISIYRNAKNKGERNPEYSLKLPKALDYFIMTLFILGIFYTIYQFF